MDDDRSKKIARDIDTLSKMPAKNMTVQHLPPLKGEILLTMDSGIYGDVLAELHHSINHLEYEIPKTGDSTLRDYMRQRLGKIKIAIEAMKNKIHRVEPVEGYLIELRMPNSDKTISNRRLPSIPEALALIFEIYGGTAYIEEALSDFALGRQESLEVYLKDTNNIIAVITRA